MSTKTLKLLNSITTTTSASHRRRNSAAVTAATFVPMFQSNVQTSFFPHCQPLQQQQQQPQNGGVNQQYHQFLPLFVTPTTPASSDHHTSYHGTNVTSPPPYYFHTTPPLSNIGGAGGSALGGAAGGSGMNQPLLLQNNYNNGTSHSGNHNTLSGNGNVNHATGASHHTRNSSLHQDALKKGGVRSVSQFSVAGSQHFQFAFEPQQGSNTIPSINNTNNNTGINNPINLTNIASHSRQPLFQQGPPSTELQQNQQNIGFSFLPLNPDPEPVLNNNQRSATLLQQQACLIQQYKSPSQGLLPGGFFSLTPEDPYPSICISNQPSTTLRDSQPSNPYFPIMPLNPVVQQIAPRTAFPTGYMRPQHQRLTRAAVASVDSRDSRDFRWNRVLRYVHEVSSVHGNKFPPSEAWIVHQRQRVMSSPRDDLNDHHSLWDGGSLGTNGVDDFIWDDDLQNGKRFTIPPKSNQGDPRAEENMMFMLEPSKSDFDLAFGYEVDDTNFRPPAKRTKSTESQKAARRSLHEYLAALKTFELSHIQDTSKRGPLVMAYD